MKLTCAQMDVLISFYIDNELSQALRKQVEEHLSSCAICSAKYDIICSMVTDMKSCCKSDGVSNQYLGQKNDLGTYQYQLFKNNLSAYIDNELNNDENLKIKKITINNKKARKALEDSFSLRKMMNDSFKKCKTETKRDFSKHIIKQLELEEEAILGIHPALKLLILFTAVLLVSSILVLVGLG